jgi:hypothetical protein
VTLEPDEDEDPIRKCVKCGFRPRWSRDARCKYCIECGSNSMLRSLRVRKDREGCPTAAEALTERRRQRNERYHALRRAGVPPSIATNASSSRKRADSVLKQLRLTARPSSASITTTLPEAITAGGLLSAQQSES